MDQVVIYQGVEEHQFVLCKRDHLARDSQLSISWQLCHSTSGTNWERIYCNLAKSASFNQYMRLCYCIQTNLHSPLSSIDGMSLPMFPCNNQCMQLRLDGDC